MHLDEFCIQNLRKLEAYLRSGKLKAEFAMSKYADKVNDEAVVVCGSVGCAVGHGPYAGIPKNIGESWYQYGLRKFFPKEYTHGSRDAWSWLFSYRWVDVDDSALGAAKRINYFLTNGGPPQVWSFDEETVALYQAY